MADVISEAMEGLKAALETVHELQGHVYVSPPEVLNDDLSVVLEPPREVNYVQVGGRARDVEVVTPITVRAFAGTAELGWQRLYELLAPSGDNSIAAAIAEDVTLGDTVDTAVLESIQEDPDQRELVGQYVGVALVRWYKSGG